MNANKSILNIFSVWRGETRPKIFTKEIAVEQTVSLSLVI
jgi:hypothetical protein